MTSLIAHPKSNCIYIWVHSPLLYCPRPGFGSNHILLTTSHKERQVQNWDSFSAPSLTELKNCICLMISELSFVPGICFVAFPCCKHINSLVTKRLWESHIITSIRHVYPQHIMNINSNKKLIH